MNPDNPINKFVTMPVLALVAVIGMLVLAYLGVYDKAAAMDFVKWVLTTFFAAQATVQGAQHISNGMANKTVLSIGGADTADSVKSLRAAMHGPVTVNIQRSAPPDTDQKK